MDSQPTVGFLLHDVARLLRKRYEQHARDLGLTRSQWQVLAYLAKNEGIHQGGLAELLEIEPITLGRIVDKLQAAGFVERRPHASDRRIWQLFLTERALPVLAEMQELGALTRSEALADIDDDEQTRLLATLGHMKANLLQALATPATGRRKKYG